MLARVNNFLLTNTLKLIIDNDGSSEALGKLWRMWWKEQLHITVIGICSFPQCCCKSKQVSSVKLTFMVWCRNPAMTEIAKPALVSSKVMPQNRWCSLTQGIECHSLAPVPQTGLREPTGVPLLWFFAAVVGSFCIFLYRSSVPCWKKRGRTLVVILPL